MQTLVDFLGRFSQNNLPDTTHNIKMNQTRVTYGTHKILDNLGPTIEISEKFSTDVVIKTLNQHRLELISHPAIITSLNHEIQEILNEHKLSDELKGVFIHNSTHGLVAITTNEPSISGTNTISINVTGLPSIKHKF